MRRTFTIPELLPDEKEATFFARSYPITTHFGFSYTNREKPGFPAQSRKYSKACPHCHSIQVDKYKGPYRIASGEVFYFGCKECHKPIREFVAKRSS